jgi:hypothetical protein
MPALHHALLGVSVVALAAAGFRLASRFAERGPARAIAAAAFAVAAAVGEAILLGLVALGGSSAALTIAALATWAAARAWLPRPPVALGGELLEWWRARSRAEQAALGALAGAAGAWAAWQLRHPALGFDTEHYHLPEMVIFVQGGHPGAITDVLPGLPVGNYPLTTEVTIAWAMGIARSFVPLVLLPWLTLALTAASGWAGLRALAVPRAIAGLAAAALCTSPWLLGWQSNGSVTDPPALAWLVACAALCVFARGRPALLVPAVVAGGLAIGCKTTVLPFTLLVLGLALWHERARLRPHARALGAALAVAALAGGGWYLRNLVDHGSPFWPLVATPWGDPLPRSVTRVATSFLDRPRATVDLLGHAYLTRFGGGLALLVVGALAPLLTRRRVVVLSSLAMGAGLLLWTRSPVTGVPSHDPLPETTFSTTRYLLPVLAAACLAPALAARAGPRRALAVALSLGAVMVVNLVQTFRLHFPVAPAPTTPLLGAVAGAVLAAAAGLLLAARRRRDGSAASARPHLRAGALVAAGLAAGALLAVPASGFVERHGRTNSALVASVVRWMAAQPSFRDGSSPVATTPAFIGVLAGDRLRHRLEALPPRSGCAEAARRAPHEWLVIYGGPLGGVAPAAVRRCLPPPAFDNGAFTVYRPPRG